MDTRDSLHFSGVNTHSLIGYVRRKLGDDAVGQLLAQAADSRLVDELLDLSTWSSYTQFRRLLQAGEQLLGDLELLVRAGAYVDMSSHHSIEALQGLGSIDSFYRNLAAAQAVVTTIVDTEAEQIAPGEWLITQRFQPGFEPFRAYCAFSRGQLSTGPPVFGFRRAEVSEERCQCDGASACQFRLRVADVGDAVHETEFLKVRLAVAEERLSELETTVADLASAADIETMLERITVTAARAVQAQGFILQLEDGQPGRRVYSHGLDPGEAELILVALSGGDDATRADRLSVRVTSQRHDYGKLVAVKPSAPFLPREAELLQTYAHFAAAVLDSATDLQTARQNASRAEALLELARELAEISTSEEIAIRLVRAVPRVIGCDRAAVALVRPGEATARFVATLGLPDGADQPVGALTLPPPPDLSGDLLHFDPADDNGMSFARQAFAITDSAGAVMIPLIVEGAWVGYIAASVSEEPARLRSSVVELRLRGLAAQASAAIQNATLLDRIRHQAFHDSLTGLPNRALILDRLEQMLARAARSHESIAVLFIDLDRFKMVNDTFGHAAGDLLIREAGSRLASAARFGDTVGRLGGDEFVVLIEGVSLGAGVEAVAERLMAVIHQPFDLSPHSRHPITVTTSIGIAAGHRPRAGDLLRDADIALYQAKDAGRARFVVFEPQMHQVLEEQLVLRTELERAIDLRQFSLAYQPVFNLKSGAIIGAEALLRWQHPDRGELQPDAFIPLLEESGLIVKVGRWALAEACLEAKHWNRRGERFTIAVNVSARQLDSAGFVGDMVAALEQSALDPSLVILEITETTIMRDTDTSIECLRMLKNIGVRISIDDFGTGYSSLAYLRQFPVDQLKIDKSFVSSINERVGGSTLIHALVQLGKTLNLETVAEGIERPIQHKALQDEDCDSGQGFLFSRPLEPAEIAEWFHEASRSA